MLTAVVTSSGSTVHADPRRGRRCRRARRSRNEAEEEHAVPENDLNPIFPEVKEVVWGFGSFVVLALAMRFFLFRKVRDGMDARYDSIQGDSRSGRGDDRVGTRRRRRLRRAGRCRPCRGAEAGRSGPGDARGRAHRPARRGQRPHRREACGRRRRGRGRQARRLARRSRPPSATSPRSRGQLATGKTPSPDAVSVYRHDRRTAMISRGCRHEPARHASVAVYGLLRARRSDVPFDDKGYITENPILAPTKEMVIGVARIADRLRSAVQVRLAIDQEELQRSHRRHPEGTRRLGGGEGHGRGRGRPTSAGPRATSTPSAPASTPRPKPRPQALLADGRVRIDVEMAELEARAEADIAAAAGRSTDELRAEIARHSGVAIDRIVDETLDDATHQALIEGFIQRVGASTGASA